MYKKILLSLSLVAVSACFGADTAGDYFHRGAQFYIWGKKPEAKNEVITGLRLFPNDAQLNGLAGLLKKEEQQQQQQQQNQQQQQQDQSRQDQNQQQKQSQQDQQKNDASQQPQEKKDQGQQQGQPQQKPKPSPGDQKQQQQAEASKNDADQKDQDQEAYAAGKMTPEQAKQLLDSQKSDEMMLPVKPEGKPSDRRRPVRDW